MVECRFQDLVGEILEREKLAYRESVVDAGFQDACHYLESVSPQEVSCEKHKRVKIKSIGLFLLEKVGFNYVGTTGLRLLSSTAREVVFFSVIVVACGLEGVEVECELVGRRARHLQNNSD